MQYKIYNSHFLTTPSRIFFTHARIQDISEGDVIAVLDESDFFSIATAQSGKFKSSKFCDALASIEGIEDPVAITLLVIHYLRVAKKKPEGDLLRLLEALIGTDASSSSSPSSSFLPSPLPLWSDEDLAAYGKFDQPTVDAAKQVCKWKMRNCWEICESLTLILTSPLNLGAGRCHRATRQPVSGAEWDLCENLSVGEIRRGGFRKDLLSSAVSVGAG